MYIIFLNDDETFEFTDRKQAENVFRRFERDPATERVTLWKDGFRIWWYEKPEPTTHDDTPSLTPWEELYPY